MGANAQTTVPTFTASQVLTADQMNQSARTGVPVFATTGTRDAAFGGTGEKTLAEGQLCYVEGTGFQTYNGTAWVTWGTAPASGGLELISSTTIGSGVATVTVSNAFSATYNAYKITMTDGSNSAAANMRLQLGGSTTGYYDVVLYVASTALNTPVSAGTSNGSLFSRIGSTGTAGHQVSIDILNPFLAKQTSFNGLYAFDTSAYGVVSGFHNVSTSYADFTISPSTGTLTGGTIKVYGYKN